MAEKKISWVATLWTNIKAYCPICKRAFTGYYCPSCGLPKKNSKYAISKYGSLHNCDHYHFRPEFSSFENFQLCDKCYTSNPYNAKYCRNCGENIVSNARDANGHGWIDLGLSVLWSSESMEDFYPWRDSTILTKYSEKLDCDFKANGDDIATIKWGKKWRVPTKEEFEELIDKCTWEKILLLESNEHALKVTGPNGKYILLKTTGVSGCRRRAPLI